MTKDFEHSGFLFGGNSVFIEELYQKYLENPNSVDQSWAEFFKAQNDGILCLKKRDLCN
jgi:2-oxoglutarate dehydrogenase E1 component